MIEQGVQIAPGQTIDEARAGINEPDNSTWSCWTSGLASPFVTFGERAEAYLDALQSGDPNKVQTIINSRFGECFNPAMNSDAPDWEAVIGRALPYSRGEVPGGGIRILMGVDVQASCLYYVIRAFGSRGTSWLVDFGQLYGPTFEDGVWADLADLMLTPLSGGLMVERVFVDAGYRPDKKEAGDYHKVYDFARRFSWLVTPTRGREVQNPPYKVSAIEVKASGKKAGFSIDVAWLSTDFFKSLLVSRMRTPMGQPGAFYIFSDEKDVLEPYARQVTSEVRVIDNGKPKWVTRGENHWFDCEAMVTAAAFTLNVQRIPEGVERASSEPVLEADASEAGSTVAEAPAPTEKTPAVPPPAALPPQGSRSVGAGVKNRFAKLGARLNR
jgi:phage terminase large subunit GpA-like protein